ncbi:MAG: 50S ribosomal protein L32 [Armatimonadota bacterium]|nr:50S ribosomal protein L32 [Armatimonadota bacterium]MDR7450293.1 50S ribosomal protein L32 [Armatimonadota bacterium]MDR7467124.1 50S ribosomal protein L32 [Armatimonadota bacterium]MDR7493334.1 50S ribosomal protein L32 [Armatimonadota bacterium]MDR7499342.1 50S ribosomal protein L32 [Armatimonadota bacterium]
MGIQKHRRSRKSGAMRRAHWKARPLTLVECPQCHRLMRSHRVCGHCGYYAGREVVKQAKEEK